MVTGLKEGNKMSTLKPIGKLYSAFKIQTNVTNTNKNIWCSKFTLQVRGGFLSSELQSRSFIMDFPLFYFSLFPMETKLIQ